MVASYHRRDISDKAWALIEPYTIGNKGTWGGNAKDTRLFINAVFWILRTGAPWCDLPPDYCNWNTVQRRFCRWRDKGYWGNDFRGNCRRPRFRVLFALGAFVSAVAAGGSFGNGENPCAATDFGRTGRY